MRPISKASDDRPTLLGIPLGLLSALGLTAALAVTLTGCAAGFASSTVEEFGSFRIEVTNDLAPRVQVYLQVDPAPNGSEARSDTLLGGAPVEGTTVFRIDLEDRSLPHRLRAALPRNQEVLSETFLPDELAGVTWILTDNELTEGVGAEEEGGGDEDARSGQQTRESPVSDHRRPTGARRIPPGS